MPTHEERLDRVIERCDETLTMLNDLKREMEKFIASRRKAALEIRREALEDLNRLRGQDTPTSVSGGTREKPQQREESDSTENIPNG